MLCMFPSTFLNIWSIFIVSILMSLLANYIISVISDFLLFDFFWLLFIFFYFFVCLVIFDYVPNVIFTVWSARYFLFILLNSVELFTFFFFSVMQLNLLGISLFLSWLVYKFVRMGPDQPLSKVSLSPLPRWYPPGNSNWCPLWSLYTLDCKNTNDS